MSAPSRDRGDQGGARRRNWTLKKETHHGEGKRSEGWGPVERVVRRFADSAALTRHVAEVSGDTCLLSFSGGKDALCAWIQVKRHFRKVVPFYLYTVPGLQFIEDGLRRYEDHFGIEIIRLPHPSLYRMLRNLVFQPPERCAAIEAANLPNLTYQQVEAHARKVSGTPDAWVAIGSRMADSPIRRANIARFGPMNHGRRSFLAVYDWLIADVEREITGAGLKLTVDYQMFGRSFDGVDYRFLQPVKERFPDDYRRILDWFPLADLEIFRRGLSS